LRRIDHRWWTRRRKTRWKEWRTTRRRTYRTLTWEIQRIPSRLGINHWSALGILGVLGAITMLAGIWIKAIHDSLYGSERIGGNGYCTL
jgi:hypothetical protein